MGGCSSKKDLTMAEEIQNDDLAQKPKSKGGGANPLLTVLVLLNTILIGAIGYFQYTSHQELANQPSVADIVKAEMMGAGDEGRLTGEAVQEDGIPIPLDSFTANLAQGDGPRRFIRLDAVLKFSLDSSEGEIRSRMPQIRDSIISILNSKRPEDLLRAEGKNYLKEEIKSAINSFFIDGEVIDVFYIGFQIS